MDFNISIEKAGAVLNSRQLTSGSRAGSVAATLLLLEDVSAKLSLRWTMSAHRKIKK